MKEKLKKVKMGMKGVVYQAQESMLIQEEDKKAEEEEAKRLKELTSANQKLEEKSYSAPDSLDLFALETRARRTIGELIKPIIAEIDNDRRKVA